MSPVPILVYHAVTADPPSWIAPFAVSPRLFGAHMEAVAASGRQPLTVSQFADGLRGLAPLPPRPVLVTVDDGFADFADHALPALAGRGIASTLYVTTGALAGSDGSSVLPPATMLGFADLAGLEEAGVEIGAHSHTHRQLDLLTKRDISDELARSRDLLAGALGHPVRSFAYPHGYWRAQVRRLAGEAGFDTACAVGNVLSTGQENWLSLSRLMVRADTDTSTVAAWMEGARVASPIRRVLAFGWRQYRRVKAAVPTGEWRV